MEDDNSKRREYLTVEDSDTPAKIGLKVIGRDFVRCSKGSIYCYDMEKHYWNRVKKEDENLFLRKLFSLGSQVKLSPKIVKEAIGWCKDSPMAQVDFGKKHNQDYINFCNGKVNIRTLELSRAEPEDYFTYCIGAEFLSDKNLTNKAPDILYEFARRSFVSENIEYKLKLFLQILGYILCDRTDAKKAFFFIGPADCGKSVLIRFITRILGNDNVSTLGIENFADRFSKAELHGKKLNASGEIPSGKINGHAADIFKGIVGNDEMTVERKFGDPFTMRPTAKLLFAGNCMPTFAHTDVSNALVERMTLLTFNNSVKKEKRDKDMVEKLFASRNQIVTQAIRELRTLIEENYQFSQGDEEKAVLRAYSESSNTLGSFLEERCNITGISTDRLKLQTVYSEYKKFCDEIGCEADNYPVFRKKLFINSGLKSGKHRFESEKNPVASVSGLKLKIYTE